MSVNSIVFRSRNQLEVNTDISKMFLWNNRFNNDIFYYDNSTSGGVYIPEGTVLGRCTSGPQAGLLVPWTSAATNGSQYPVGLMGPEGVWVDYGETFQGSVSYCVQGDVDGYKIGTQGSDNLQTVVEGRQLFDWLGSVSGGIRVKFSDQNTAFDNQE